MASTQPRKVMLQNGQEPAGPPPPPGFKAKKDSAMSGGVMKMITQLIEDSEAMVKEAGADETESLTAYEGYIAEANKATEVRRATMTDLKMEIGKSEQFAIETKQKLAEATAEKQRLRQHDIDLHGVEGCQ